jgi:hypothetical protein
MAMANGFVVTKEDWEHMEPKQQGWLMFNAIQSIDGRVEKLEKRPLMDKCFSFLGGVIGGFAAALGIKWGGQ